MTNTNELAVIERDLIGEIDVAKAVQIVDAKSMTHATAALSRLNKISDRITEEKEKITKPLNEALKAERARWKPLEAQLEAGIGAIRTAMSTYQTKKLQEEREAEAKIAARVGEGKGKLKVETAVKKIDEIERADKIVASGEGVVKFREDKRVKIMDETMIPREYLVIDEKKVLEALKEGKSVPGAVLEVVQVPVNFR